ncbi:MAG: hypothetical protein AB9922_11055 [Bacteroidales bacterium]
MGEINKILNDFESERAKEEYKKGLIDKKRGWHKEIITAITIVTTILILLIDKLLPLSYLEDKFLYKIIIVIIACIFGIVIFILNNYADKRMINVFSTQYTKLNIVLKIFAKLENTLENYVPKIEEASKNIHKSPISNLISWDLSERYEKHAKTVWSFSYSLDWLIDDQNRIEGKCQELLCNTDHNYRYILDVKDEHNRKNIIAIINDKIRNFESINNCNIMDRFEIKGITTKVEFPIPNDISVYHNVFNEYYEGAISEKKNLSFNNLVVINTEGSKHNCNGGDSENYDIIFSDPVHVTRVSMWFEEMWKSID